MKKNIGKLIIQVQQTVSQARNKSVNFKVTSKNANTFTNKIMVDAEAYNKPTSAMQFVKSQLKEYPILTQSYKQKEQLQRSINKKKDRLTIEDKLVRLQKNFSYLLLEQIMQQVLKSTGKDLQKFRDKLIRLQNELSFRLQEEISVHFQQSIITYMKQLTRIINKMPKVY